MWRFATPWLLLLLAVVPPAVWWLARRRGRGDARVDLPSAGLHLRRGSSPWTRIDGALPWLRGLVLMLLVVAVARPQSGARIEDVSSFGVDIVVALDVSGSMRAEDFQPRNRLEVARQTVERFVLGRSSDRVGLVVFAALASTRCPLTLDHDMLLHYLDQVDFAPADQDGTAIGLALATAVNRLRDSSARSRVAVLVTDGRNNKGQIGPRAAAEAARALDVKVYTVGVGSEGEVPIPVDYGAMMGRAYQMMRVDLDEELLRHIADVTGGEYFRATDAESLTRVFGTIDDLEKSEVESRVRVLYSELFALALTPALLLLLVERLLLATRLKRVP